MKRLSFRDEGGMVAVLSAILATVLFGFLALVIDAGLIYGERRALQRTADSAALAGGQMIPTGDAGLMESVAIDYVDGNPSMGHDEYDSSHDMVEALPLTTGGCFYEGQAYDCMDIEIVTPGLDLFFAPMLGVDQAEVSARSRAVLGSGAPGGDKLVPWVILDCPDTDGSRGYTDEQGGAVAAAFAAANPGITCPYTFSDDYNTGQQALFLDTGSGGNFGAADLAAEPNCEDQAVSGYFSSGGGGNEYRTLLEGEASPEVPCHIGGGARFHTKTGQITGPTDQGLDARNIDACMNLASFNEAVDVGDVGDGVVTIKDTNPCLVALIFAVHTRGTDALGSGCEAPNLKEAFYAGRIKDMQSDEVLGDVSGNDCNSDLWRFAPLLPPTGSGAGGGGGGGTSAVLIVRRHAFFYITQHNNGNSNSGNPKVSGLFLRAIDSKDAILTGPYDPSTGISILRLIPPD